MALPRDTLIESAVIGGTAGLFAAGVNIAARYTSDPGDVLGFVGGAVGAGAAVVGALWVERHKARQSDRDRLDAMARMVVGLSERADNVLRIEAARQASAIRTLRQSIGTFAAMRASHLLVDPDAQALLDTYAEKIEEVRAALRLAEARMDRGETTPAEAVEELRSWMSIVIRATAAVLRYDAGWSMPWRIAAERIAEPHW